MILALREPRTLGAVEWTYIKDQHRDNHLVPVMALRVATFDEWLTYWQELSHNALSSAEIRDVKDNGWYFYLVSVD